MRVFLKTVQMKLYLLREEEEYTSNEVSPPVERETKRVR
jgi:hypothetical protein